MIYILTSPNRGAYGALGCGADVLGKQSAAQSLLPSSFEADAPVSPTPTPNHHHPPYGHLQIQCTSNVLCTKQSAYQAHIKQR